MCLLEGDIMKCMSKHRKRFVQVPAVWHRCSQLGSDGRVKTWGKRGLIAKPRSETMRSKDGWGFSRTWKPVCVWQVSLISTCEDKVRELVTGWGSVSGHGISVAAWRSSKSLYWTEMSFLSPPRALIYNLLLPNKECKALRLTLRAYLLPGDIKIPWWTLGRSL